jgi:hypothetical protein
MPPGGIPGSTGYGFPQQPQQGNGFAIAGLVFGIAGFCVLFLGGLVGLILGIIGLKKTSNPAVGGKGMSIAAIVLSLISLLTSVAITAGIGGTIWGVTKASAVPRATARQFVQDLAAGNMSAARAAADSSITDSDLDALSTKLKANGTFVDMTAFGVNIEATPGKKTCAVAGVVKLSNGQVSSNFELIDAGNGWKITKADIVQGVKGAGAGSGSGSGSSSSGSSN